MIRFFFVIILASFGTDISIGKRLPSFVKKCKHGDPQLDDCMKNSFLEFRKYLKDGVKEMKLVSHNPYMLTNANLQASWMNTTFSNMKMWGSENYDIDYFKLDLDNGKLWLNTTTAFMEMKSHYVLLGKLLQFTLEGEGEMEAKYNNSKANMVLHGKKVYKKGKEYLSWESIDYKIIGNPLAYIHFHDLFRNNPELTDTVNRLIVENRGDLSDEIVPLAEKIVSAIALSLFKGVFDTFSIRELFD